MLVKEKLNMQMTHYEHKNSKTPQTNPSNFISFKVTVVYCKAHKVQVKGKTFP
jgi:hypothetical protein